MTILYQNNRTGDTWDITTLISAAKWSTKRTGSPATIDLTAIDSPEVTWENGGIIAVREADQGLFYGYVFKLSSNEKGQVSITAYDQTRYLKNKDTYVFTGKRADEIVSQIAADFKLKVGALDNTGYVIPSLVEDNQSLFDIVLKALDLTLINSGRMFYLWDDFGSLRISDVAEGQPDLVVGDSSLATGYTYDTEIDSETYNKIKLVRDNQDTGKRDVYIFQDSDNMRLWGVLQDFEKVNEELNEAQIKERGNQMLELYNRPKRTFSISAFSDLSVRAGKVLYVAVKDLQMNQAFIVEEASHDLLKNTMSLKLKVV